MKIEFYDNAIKIIHKQELEEFQFRLILKSLKKLDLLPIVIDGNCSDVKLVMFNSIDELEEAKFYIKGKFFNNEENN